MVEPLPITTAEQQFFIVAATMVEDRKIIWILDGAEVSEFIVMFSHTMASARDRIHCIVQRYKTFQTNTKKQKTKSEKNYYAALFSILLANGLSE